MTGICRVCGCTDEDCRQCIERTGQPCHWVQPDLCSACAGLSAQLIATKAVVRHAMETHGFDLVLVVSVKNDQQERLSFECALDGLVPPYASGALADGLREVADRVEQGMNLQTAAHEQRERGVS